MRVLILNGPARGTVVSVTPRIMLTPEGKVPMFQAEGDKGIMTYRVGIIIHEGRRFRAASAASSLTIQTAFNYATNSGVVGPENIEEAVRAFNKESGRDSS